MNYFVYTFGQQKKFFSEQESRLVHVDVIDKTVEYFAPGDYPLHIDKTAEKLREGITSVDGIEMKMLMKVPENVAIRLSEILEEKPDETKAVIIQTAKFFDANPGMDEFFKRYDVTKYDVAKFKTLISVKAFLDVFENDPHITSTAKPAVASLGVGTADEFINHFDPIERQRMFQIMVLRHIPVSVRTPGSPYFDPNAESMFAGGADAFDPTTIRGAANTPKAARIASVILGTRKEADISLLKVTHSDEVDIAKQSLRAHFGMQVVRPPMRIEPLKPTDGMVEDYVESTRLLELKGYRTTSVSAELIKSELPPSYLNGTFETGLLDQSSLDIVHTHLVEKEDETAKVLGSSGHSLENLKGSTRRAIEREAQTMGDVFSELSGFQKLALGAVALYFANKFRGATLALGVAYFADKFLTKGQGVETILNLAKRGGNALSKESVGSTDPKEIAKRSEHVANFLGEYQSENMTEEATGFGLMTRISLADIAKSFRMHGEGIDSDWRLNVDRNSPVMLRMKEIANEEGWSRRYLQFFNNLENKVQISDALSFVFFRLALRDPRNGKDADIVSAALRSSPVSNSKSTFEKLNDLGNEEAMESYVRLIVKGRELASGESRTLGDFLAQEQGL